MAEQPGQSRAIRALIQTVQAALDWVYPRHCYSCGVPLNANRRMLCRVCSAALIDSRIVEPMCRKCGLKLVGPEAPGTVCTTCAIEQRHFETARAFVRYAAPAAGVVRYFKFYGDYAVGPRLLASMLKMGWMPQSVSAVDVVLPVPLHARRRRERGYDQAALLAQTVARHIAVKPAYGALVRTRYTSQQALLSVNRRWANVRGAFQVAHPARVHRHRILLVDDVMTTGATFSECARTLKKAGARLVYALALARTGP